MKSFQRAHIQIGQLLIVLVTIILIAPSILDDAGIACMLLLYLVITSLVAAMGPLVAG